MSGLTRVDVVEVGTGPATPEAFVIHIRASWQKSVEGIMETGRYLLQAKETLPDGEFGSMFAADDERTLGHVPFSVRTAQRLMAVTVSPRLIATHASRPLPSSWMTLYELTRLSDEDYRRVEPHISPEFERKDIKRLLPHVSRNDGENEWYTPPDYIEAARDFMGGIDLDPATSEIANRTVRAAQIFTAEDNGLLQPWHGRVWMNPPYASELVGRFAAKLCEHVDAGDVTAAAVLVNNSTETQWFQVMAARAHSICFPLKRVRFLDPDGKPGAPLQGQAVIGIGGGTGDFLYAFRGFGLCVGVHHMEGPPDE